MTRQPAIGQRELALPHPGVQRKRVKKDERAARPSAGRRRRLEISQASNGWHDPL